MIFPGSQRPYGGPYGREIFWFCLLKSPGIPRNSKRDDIAWIGNWTPVIRYLNLLEKNTANNEKKKMYWLHCKNFQQPSKQHQRNTRQKHFQKSSEGLDMGWGPILLTNIYYSNCWLHKIIYFYLYLYFYYYLSPWLSLVKSASGRGKINKQTKQWCLWA